MKSVFLVIALAAIGAPNIQVLAQGSLSGRVSDAATGLPLERSHVVLEGLGVGTSTGSDGRFILRTPDTGTHVVVVTRLGYEPFSEVVRVESGETHHLDIRLRQDRVGLPEILVEQASMTGGMTGLVGIPGSAAFLPLRHLQKFAIQDIHRALRAVPGVNIQEEDGYGLRPNIGIRGTGSERSAKITIMEDGVPIAPAPYAAPAAYFFPAVGRMSGIEVRKGSSQIRYGPVTTGGAINLLSTPIPERRSGSLRLLGGSDGNLLLHAWAGDGAGRVSWLVETYRAQTEGFKRLDGGGNTGFDRTEFLGKMRITSRPGARVEQSLLLKAGFANDDSRETYLGLTENDFGGTPHRRYAGSGRDEMDAEQAQFLARWRVVPSAGFEVVTSAYHTRFDRNWYKLDGVQTSSAGAVGIGDLLENPEQHPEAYALVSGNPTDPSDVLRVKANNRGYRATGLQVDTRIETALGVVESGIRAHTDLMDRFQWVDTYSMSQSVMSPVSTGAPGSDSNRIERARALAGYFQVGLGRGRLTATPGLRMERIRQEQEDFGKADPDRTGSSARTKTNSATAIMPGLGLSYRLREGWSLFSGVHRGFAPPGPAEGARPESSVNYEIGTRLDRSGVRGEAVIYYNDYSNLLGADLAAGGGAGSTALFNGGSARVYGLELSVGRNLGDLTRWKVSIPVQAAFSLTQATFQSSFESDFEPWGSVQKGDHLAYVPERQFSWSIGVEGGRFEIELAGQHTGFMRAVAGIGQPASGDRIPGHFVLDVSLDAKVRSGMHLFVTVRNLTDEVYIAARRPAGLRPGLPRTVMAGIRASL